MGRDDIYPVRTSKVGCLLQQTTDRHAPVAATTVFSTPDDGRRKRPKYAE